MRLGRRDANEGEIVEALERYGCHVVRAEPLVAGFPDLIVEKDGIVILVEVKNAPRVRGKTGLNPEQRKFHAWWRGHITTVTSPQGAVNEIARILESL